jgi:PAS domain S-box-containing protein
VLNTAAEELIGIKSGDAFSGFMDRTGNRLIIDNFIKVFLDGKRRREEVQIKKDGALRTYAVILGPVNVEGKINDCVAVLRDITEKKKVDSLKIEFLNMVSHELKAPLTPIKVYSELMMLQKFDGEKVREYAGKIFRSTLRLSAMKGDLLDMSRIEAGRELILNVEEFEIEEILE